MKPLELGRTDLVSLYRDLLTGSPNLSILPIDQAVAGEAGRIRAQYRFRTPDALHLAAAVVGGADLFVTNAPQLRRFHELSLMILLDHTTTP